MKWKSKKYLAVLLTLVLLITNLLPCMPVFAYTQFYDGQTISVIQKQKLSGAGNGYFDIGSSVSWGFCAQNSKKYWNNNEAKTGRVVVWDNATVRKVLYYSPGSEGYTGSNQAYDMDSTTYAIGYLNGDSNNNARATARIAEVEGLQDPIIWGYQAFYVYNDETSYQDIAFLGEAKYTVTYDGNGGLYNGSSTWAENVTYMDEYTTWSNNNFFVRPGYTFDGWKDQNGTDWTDWIDRPWEWSYQYDVTLYAQWKPNSYTVKYDGNGATSGSISDQQMNYDSSAALNTGTLKKEYTITYDGNGGEPSADKSVATAPFKGWEDHNSITYNGTTYPWYAFNAPYYANSYYDVFNAFGYDKTAMLSHWLTYTVNGTASYNSSEYFNLKYYMSNGGQDLINAYGTNAGSFLNHWIQWGYTEGRTGISSVVYNDRDLYPAGATVRNLTYDSGSTLTLKARWGDATTVLETATRPGYIFLGWNTESDGSGTAYSAGDSYTATKNITLYAQWEPENQYKITYRLDYGENHADNPETYVAGVGVEKLYPATKDGYQFKGWYEDADFTVPIESIGTDREGDLILYAKWDQMLVVVYHENITEDGATKQDVVSKDTLAVESHGNYAVKANVGFTDYRKEHAAFRGWDADKYQSPVNASFQTLPAEIGFDELLSFAYRGSTFSLRSRAVAVAETTTVDGVEEVPVVNLYAIWDEAPEIYTENDSILEFYEGEYVTKEMLLENVIAYDPEEEYISNAIRITKIEYAEGRLEDGDKQEGYEVVFDGPNGMTDADALDTWFLQMEKDAVVTHYVTYEVTDSYGNTTTFRWPVKVKYNEAPEIQGADRYFTLQEAQNGKITLEVLLEQARAWDKEDCSEHRPDGKHGLETCLNQEEACKFTTDKLSILGYDADKFTKYTKAGYEILSYHVIDQYGKETLKQFVVYILDDQEQIPEANTSKTVRFIDEKYYEKNYEISLSGLSEKEMGVLNQKEEYQNGGLSVGSDWYTNTAYRILLIGDEETSTKGVFERIKDDSLPALKEWFFPKEEVASVKDYVKTKGIGNSQSEDGLQNFLALFPAK